MQTQGRPATAAPCSKGLAATRAADSGRVHGVAPGDVRLCLALCKAMQRLITLMWRELVWTSEAHASCKVLGRSILPEPIEAVGAQFGISHRVRDVAVAEVVLKRAGIDAVIG